MEAQNSVEIDFQDMETRALLKAGRSWTWETQGARWVWGLPWLVTHVFWHTLFSCLQLGAERAIQPQIDVGIALHGEGEVSSRHLYNLVSDVFYSFL